MEIKWPPGAREILAVLDHEPRSRTVLLAVTRVDFSDWHEAITFLVEQCLAIRSGSKRGTRYTRALAKDSKDDILMETRGAGESSPYTVNYHDELAEAFGQLGMTPVRIDGVNLIAKAAGKVSLKASPAIGGGLEAAVVGLKEITEVIDFRDRGGCLWVLERPGVSKLVRQVEKAHKVQFRFTNGSKATKGRPAWWSTFKRKG